MELFYNRELSWLQFNDRVLQEAQDTTTPLLQRLRFLGIFSNNQDEFIKVRLANLIRYSYHNRDMKMTGDISPQHLISLVNDRMALSETVFSQTYSQIIEELEGQGIFIRNNSELTETQVKFCRDYFLTTISIRLVPILLHNSVKTPFLPDNKIYLAVRMQLKDKQKARYAILEVPVSSACPRFVVLPSDQGRVDVIFLEDIIRLFLDDIFFMFNYTNINAYTFKLVRDAELVLDDDQKKSQTQQMNQSLEKRERAKAIRMVFDRAMPSDTLSMIAKKLEFKSTDQIEAAGKYQMMRDLMKFPRVNQKLENEVLEPKIHHQIDPFKSILKVISKQDILLCYPYHTFNHTIDMLREAAVDPTVESIYISLYRTAHNSKIINALVGAVKNGKKVNVLVELKARFDEEQNIENAEYMLKNGIKVIYSDDQLKVHSKLILIKKESERGYVYVGTGNFNEDTATIYSDFALLTANSDIVQDAQKVFDFLEDNKKIPKYKKLMVAPHYLRGQIEEILEQEIKAAQNGEKAYFYAKFNALTDIDMIKQLYRASQAGVEIRLVVRGACCLEPGVRGVSENIQVRSIVDRFLEHSRLIICGGRGRERSYIMSADLMKRNLDRRVEVGVEIESVEVHKTLRDYFDIQWKGNVKARIIEQPYTNKYVEQVGEKVQSQLALYEYFCNKK